MLLHHAGPEVRRTFQSLKVVPADGESPYDSALRTLTEFFCVRENVFFERFVLDELQPLAGESTQNFVLRLRSQARFCKLSCAECHCSFEDDRIMEVALRNTDKPQIRSRCFEKRVTDLDAFLTIARDFEASLAESSAMCRRSAVVSQADSTALCSSEDKPSVSTAASSSTAPSGDNPLLASSTTQVGKKTVSRPLKRRPPHLCKYCNTDHPFNRQLCPAWGKVCSACSSRNHFAVCCPDKSASCVEACTGALSYGGAFCLSTGCSKIFGELYVNGLRRRFLLDTGSNRNIVPPHLVPSGEPLLPAPPVHALARVEVQPLGRVWLKVGADPSEAEFKEFLVIPNVDPILSVACCLQFGFLSLNAKTVSVQPASLPSPPAVRQSSLDFSKISVPGIRALVEEFSDIFSPTIGSIKGVKSHIQLKKDAAPRFRKARPVALSLKEKVKTTLDKMVRTGNLAPIRHSE